MGNGVGFPFVPDGPKYDPGYPYLLYVGSRKPHKNLPRLLKAYSISGVREDVHLLLSGEPDQHIVAEINRLGLEGYVFFRDLAADGELSDAYRGAVAFIFPSLYEGFGLPPLEAMACGIPVLTSNVCALPEVVSDAAILVDPLTVEDIAAGLVRLVNDSALRALLSGKGFKSIQGIFLDGNSSPDVSSSRVGRWRSGDAEKRLNSGSTRISNIGTTGGAVFHVCQRVQ